MSSTERFIRIEIQTKDGKIHSHDFPASPEAQTEVDKIMAQATMIISEQSGALVMGNPRTVYAANQIAHIRDYEIPNN
ncbi:MAG: hypothetical protein OXF79_21070 [Chloroflexi bacterium]|nr:hypothetical protein [Chloroflexota bacterium]